MLQNSFVFNKMEGKLNGKKEIEQQWTQKENIPVKLWDNEKINGN